MESLNLFTDQVIIYCINSKRAKKCIALNRMKNVVEEMENIMDWHPFHFIECVDAICSIRTFSDTHTHVSRANGQCCNERTFQRATYPDILLRCCFASSSSSFPFFWILASILCNNKMTVNVFKTLVAWVFFFLSSLLARLSFSFSLSCFCSSSS